MKFVEVFVVLLACELVRTSKIIKEEKETPLNGAQAGFRKARRPGNGPIISHGPVITQQERSRQRVNFISRAGRRIVRLIDFVQSVLSTRAQRLRRQIQLNNEATEGMDEMKATKTFLTSAASKLQTLEQEARDLFEELSAGAKILPAIKVTNRQRPRKSKNKFRKFNRQPRFRAPNGNRTFRKSKKANEIQSLRSKN